MRQFKLFPFIAALVSCLSVGVVALGADDQPASGPVTLHVAENAPPGTLVAELGQLMDLDASSRLQISDGSGFTLGEDGRLLVSEGGNLDFETLATHEITIEVESSLPPDALRERFAAIAGEAGVDGGALKQLARRRQQQTLQIVVDDQPEGPQLSGGGFWRLDLHDAATQRPLGQVIASDPDHDESLRYELLSHQQWLRIDPVSGAISLRAESHLPNIGTLNVIIQVADATGLTDQQQYRLGWYRSPQTDPEATPSAPPPAVKATSDEPSIASTGGPAEDMTPAQVLLTSDLLQEVSVAAVPVEDTVVPSETSQPAAPTPTVTSAVGTVAESETPPSGFEQHSLSQAAASAAVATPAPTIEPKTWAPSPMRLLIWSTYLFCACGLLMTVRDIRNRRRIRRLTATAPTNSEIEPESDETVGFERQERAESRLERLVGLGSPQSTSPTSARVADGTESASVPSTVASSDVGMSVDNWMDHVLQEAGLPSVETQRLQAMSATLEANQDFATLARLTSGHRRRGSDLTDEELSREQAFREIARSSHYGHLARSDRRRTQETWRSIGPMITACIVLGVVCLFSNVFGEVSSAIGTLLMSVGAALAMRRSLYIRNTPGRRASDFDDASSDALTV